MRGWSVLGRVRLIGPSESLLFSPRGSLDRLKSFYALLPYIEY